MPIKLLLCRLLGRFVGLFLVLLRVVSVGSRRLVSHVVGGLVISIDQSGVLFELLLLLDAGDLLEVLVLEHEDSFNLGEFLLEHLLPLQQLGNELVLPLDLLLEHSNDVVFAVEHISEITSERCEAIVRRTHCLALLHGHSTFEALICSLAFRLLVLNDVHAHDHGSAIDARHGYVRADGLVAFNFCAHAFCLAVLVALAFYRLVAAVLVVESHIGVTEHFIAAHQVVAALELHLL